MYLYPWHKKIKANCLLLRQLRNSSLRVSLSVWYCPQVATLQEAHAMSIELYQYFLQKTLGSAEMNLVRMTPSQLKVLGFNWIFFYLSMVFSSIICGLLWGFSGTSSHMSEWMRLPGCLSACTIDWWMYCDFLRQNLVDRCPSSTLAVSPATWFAACTAHGHVNAASVNATDLTRWAFLFFVFLQHLFLAVRAPLCGGATTLWQRSLNAGSGPPKCGVR